MTKKITYIFKIEPAEEQKLLDALLKYGSVKIGKFGIFELRRIKERINGVTPIINKQRINKAYTKIAFRALKKTKEYVNNQMDTAK